MLAPFINQMIAAETSPLVMLTIAHRIASGNCPGSGSEFGVRIRKAVEGWG
jgi:hypothetical protein